MLIMICSFKTILCCYTTCILLDNVCFGLLPFTHLSCQEMSNRINDIFDLLNQFIQSIPRINETAAAARQPLPAVAGKGPSMKLVKSKRLQASQIAAKSRESRIKDFESPGISTVVFEQEPSKTAVDPVDVSVICFYCTRDQFYMLLS